MLRWLTIPILVLVACRKDHPYLGEPCEDPVIDWANTGQPFTLTWCQSCHGSQQVGSARLGAPDGVRFDTLGEVKVHASRIEARVLGEAQTMPPATTIPADALEPFRQWMECGLPGDYGVPDEPAICQSPLFSGDVTLSTVDADFCDAWSGIDGNLVIDAESPVLDCLCDVTGTITVVGFPGDTVRMPLLTHAAGLLADGEPTIRTLDLPVLATVDQSVELLNLPALVSAEFQLLSSIGADLVVENVPLLWSVGVHNLEDVGANVRLVNDATLSFFLPFDSLLRVGGDLEVRATAAGSRDLTGDAEDFRRVAEIGGFLGISENPSIRTLKGYDLLESVGGDLAIAGNLQLADLDTMPVLEFVGADIYVVGNPLLDPQDARNLTNGIEEVVGDIILTE